MKHSWKRKGLRQSPEEGRDVTTRNLYRELSTATNALYILTEGSEACAYNFFQQKQRHHGVTLGHIFREQEVFTLPHIFLEDSLGLFGGVENSTNNRKLSVSHPWAAHTE